MGLEGHTIVERDAEGFQFFAHLDAASGYTDRRRLCHVTQFLPGAEEAHLRLVGVDKQVVLPEPLLECERTGLQVIDRRVRTRRQGGVELGDVGLLMVLYAETFNQLADRRNNLYCYHVYCYIVYCYNVYCYNVLL